MSERYEKGISEYVAYLMGKISGSPPAPSKELLIHWLSGIRPSYTSGSTLRLFLDKFGKDLTVEIQTNKLVLIPELKPKKENAEKGIMKLKDSSKFNGKPLKAIEQSYMHPCLFLECIYTQKNGQIASIFPGGITRIPVPIHTDSSSPEEIELSVKATSLEDRKIIFSWKQMTKRDKFLRFLEWQKTLIYGPAKGGFKEGKFICENSGQGTWGELNRKKILYVSATGKTNHSMVCSPFVSQFLAYWLNYNQYYTFKSGADRDNISANTQSIGSKGNKINGYGNFLEKKLKPGGGENWRWPAFWRKILNDDAETTTGDIYVCATGTHVWLVVKFGPRFTFPKHLIFGGSDLSACNEGFYMIHASGPSYLYSDNDIPPSRGILLDKYMRNTDDNKLNKLIKKYEKNLTYLSEAGVTHEIIIENLKAALKKMKDNSNIKGIKVFNATSLVTKNGKIEARTIGRKKKLQIYINHGNDENGNDYERIARGSFKIWKVKDVLDDNGIIDKSKAKDKYNMWLGGRPKEVDLSLNDCRYIENI